MNKSIVAASVILTFMGTAPVWAANSSDQAATSNKSEAQSQSGQGGTSHVNVRQQLQSDLSKDGYTDINIAPSSFLVHAKNKQGNPVAMVIGPDSVTVVTEASPNGQANSNGQVNSNGQNSKANQH